MKNQDKLKFIVGVGAFLFAIIYFVQVIYSIVIVKARYDVDGIFITSFIFIIPLFIGATLMIWAHPDRAERLKIGRIASIVVAIFYLHLLVNILYYDGYRVISLRSFSQLIDGLKLDANFIPFKTIIYYIKSLMDGSMNRSIPIINLSANIIMFIPAGIILPTIFSKLRQRKSAYMKLIALVIIMESTQYILGLGSLDIDDIILNYLGAILGWELFNFKTIQIFMKKIYLLDGNAA